MDVNELRKVLQFIITNPVRKIFAILFAFGLWFFVAIGKDYQYTKEIRITYAYLPESLILVDSAPTIRVTFRGRGGALLSTWAAPPRARCNLRNMAVGANEIPAKNLIVPLGFSDISVAYPTAKSVNVTVDERVSKRIEINVPLKGSVREGYSIDNIIALDTVFVTGPNRLLRDLSELVTETLTVNDKSSSYMKNLKIVDIAPLVEMSQRNVQVEIKLDTTIQKLFTTIPLRLIFTPSQRVSSEKTILDTLIVTGSRNRIEKLSKRDIDVRITLTKLSPGDYNLPASIILPDYIKPVYSYPKRFKIKVQ